MSFYGFKVGILCEMYPRNASLLGLNVGGGSKICIRLRPPHNKDWFLPMNDLIGTMLHELAHNQCGPHNDQFYKLLDTLKEKYYEVQAKGSYQATGYLMEENKLGRASLSSMTVRELRLRKLTEPKYIAKVGKLGTLQDMKNIRKKSMRELILEATERRLRDNKLCSSHMEESEINEVVPADNDLEILDLSQEAKRTKDHEIVVEDDIPRKKPKSENNEDIIIID
ncbi:DEKNAAC101917 [Brettanomyces naardenensis]|uniref:DEKNAAC101917 n=1 Tax=Brettanomyces naardenensis TaxID=13370 RepID=A0A448YJC5_BRENA|nr:DEKNAAC101917 [Brettanomyces naardenensis]